MQAKTYEFISSPLHLQNQFHSYSTPMKKLLTLLAFLNGAAMAQSLPSGAVATVNGEPISTAMYEQNLRANLAQGIKDSPQLRQTVKEELITRELLAQYAEKLGIDKTPEAKLQLKQVRENLLVEMLLAAYLQQNPITEEEVKADYKRQLSLLGQTGNTMQYKISVIVVSTASRARWIANVALTPEHKVNRTQ